MYLVDGYHVGDDFEDLLARHLAGLQLQSRCLWTSAVRPE